MSKALPAVFKADWLGAKGRPTQVPRDRVVCHAGLTALIKASCLRVSRSFAEAEPFLCNAMKEYMKVRQVEPTDKRCSIRDMVDLRDWLSCNRRVTNYEGRPVVYPQDRSA